jgi:hypothetical protein
MDAQLSAQSEQKGGYTLSMVPFLDGASDWLDFADGIETFLIMNDKLDWLDTHEDRPAGNGTPAKEWVKRHKFAVYAIRARCNYNAKQLISGISSYQDALHLLERNYRPQGDGTFREYSDTFFTITLADYKNVEEYTKAVKKLVNQMAKMGVVIPEPLVVIRYLQGLGSAYSVFYTTLTTNYQILPSDNDNTIDFDAVALKTKGHEKTLQQQEQQESAVANVAATQTIQTAMVSQDTKQIEVPYCTHCNKPYHNVRKCYILHPELKNSNSRKRKPKRQRVETGNESDGSIGLVAHCGMAATSDTGSLLHTQWIVNTACSRYITHLREHFVSYTLITQSATVVRGLAGASVTPIRKGTVKIRCKIKGKTRTIKLTNVYHIPDSRVNLISVDQLFKVKATVNFSPQYCKIKTRDKVLTATSRDGCWFLDTTLE